MNSLSDRILNEQSSMTGGVAEPDTACPRTIIYDFGEEFWNFKDNRCCLGFTDLTESF